MSILNEANDLKDTIIQNRRYIHENAEIGFDLSNTSKFVFEKLKEMGYDPSYVGDNGVTALAGGKKPGKVFLLRADMDALPIIENSDLPFKSKTENMHACGHDFHTSMLLGAAQLLKNHEDEIEGQVKFMFQPAEETLKGAQMMIDNGILENPSVDAAMMIHVTSGTDVPTGTVLVYGPNDGTAAADWFKIKIQGKGSHGAMPNTGVDPLNVMAHIYLALENINAREISPLDAVALTMGYMRGGTVENVIPDTAELAGTMRSKDSEVRTFVKKRIKEISESVGETFRAKVTVEFSTECPVMKNDGPLHDELMAINTALLGEDMVVDLDKNSNKNSGLGSEDFACVSEKVPSVTVSFGSGPKNKGHIHPLHHPQVTFDEDALPIGAAVYANSAMEWLKRNKK